jgi:eukaryotic-like serine/threonine-protein kinase
MTPPKLDEAAIFNVARQITSEDTRREYLDQACRDDRYLRARVEALLRVHDEDRSFLQRPAEGVPASPEPRVREGPGTQIGPYKLLQQIGEGGFGTVFMAEQQQPIRRLVALKIVKPGMDTRHVVARFEAERQALALMDHPNIARVLDVGATVSGLPYFVMELVKGVPITRYCDEHRLTPQERLRLFAGVCQAVHHAHQKGIIHRDLKPTNVLIAAYDGKPVPKLIDFGVAKALGQSLTERTLVTGFGNLVGTLEYMSPEQAEFNALDVDTRADIYGLGVLLYELLTGTTPLTHARLKESVMSEALRLIREEDPPKPSLRLSESKESLSSISAQRKLEPAQLTKEVRGDLDWIVMKCLEKDRNRRYDTAGALATELERYLRDEPVEACPPSVWYRSRKLARRHRMALGAAALVLFFIGLLGIGAGWAIRDRAARSASLRQEVGSALEEAQTLAERDKLSEAVSAVKRAEALLAGVDGNADLHEGVRQWRSDLDMARRLEEIRLEGAAVKDENFDNAAADPAYRKALRDYGLDLDVQDPEAVAERIRASSIKNHLLASLDDWMWQGPKPGRPGMAGLTSIARAVDADPWRDKLRDALQRRDGAFLESLAREKQVQTLPPASQLHLAKALAALDKRAPAIEVLRQAQRRHEGDFWINHELGRYLCVATPARSREAVGFFRAALALRPGNPGVHLNLGAALLSQDSAEAEAEFRAALQLKPDYADARNNLGRALLAQGKTREAIAEFHEALRLKADLAEALVNLGAALGRQRQFDEAIAKLKEAIHLKPNFATAHWYLGDALLNQRQFDEAIGEYQEAIRCNPNVATTHLNLGTALWRRDRHEEAMAEYRQAIRLEPGNALAHYNLGFLLYGQKRLDEALAEYKETVAIDPKHAQAHFGMGNAFRDQGRIDDAIAEYRKAIHLKPDFANAHYNLGVAFQKQGDLEQAAACYREAVRLMPALNQARSDLQNVEKLLKTRTPKAPGS